MVRKQLIPIGLSTLVSLTTIAWVGTGILHPSIVLAKPLEVNLPVRRQGAESYESLLARADNLAKVTINQRFQQIPSLEEIKVVIVGENNGAIAPILSIKVKRQGWQMNPNVQDWATYFTDSKLLLGFAQPVVKPEATATEKPSPPLGEGTPAGDSNQIQGQGTQKPQGEQPIKPEQLPLTTIEPTPEENPAPVPTQRVRGAGREKPPSD